MSDSNDTDRTQTFDPLRSITRLLVGGAILGTEAFLQGLRGWEQKMTPLVSQAAEGAPADPENGSMPERTPSAAEISSETEARLLPANVVVEGDILDAQFKDIVQGEVLGAGEPHTWGYALVGATFAATEGLRWGASVLGRLGRAADRYTAPLVNPLQNSRALRPARRGFERLVRRGEQEVAGWIETGRREAGYSRRLAQTALTTTVDESIEYMSKNEEIQELITAQSTGLATEMVEEVRERTVSADTFIEGMLRAVLRMTPRSSLPEPPEEVRKQAVSFHDIRKKRLEQIKMERLKK